MKRSIALAALLMSAPAWSCPNLAGTYTCIYQDGSKEALTISQAVINGVTVYDYAGSRIVGDNAPYPIPNDESLRGATYRAWCDAGANLRAQIVGTYFSKGLPYGELILDMTYALDGADVKQTTRGQIRNSGGGRSPLDSEQTCIRR